MSISSVGGAASRPRVAVVDDEALFCEIVRDQLLRAGFKVSVFHTGTAFLEQFAATAPDLVILDYYLENENGLDVCRKFRLISQAPVIMLTGLSESSAIVSCLEAGADDYVLKPYEPEQLLARIRALLRRSSTAVATGNSNVVVPFGDISVNTVDRVACYGEVEVQFGEREFGLLAALMTEYPQMLDRERCSWIVLRREWLPGDRAIDVLVSRVREKLRKLGSRLDIVTLRARGYALRDPLTPQVEDIPA